MIVSGLNGGLGNQMFQYAAAYALSLKLNQPLGVDLSAFKTPTQTPSVIHRQYELKDVFNITSTEVDSEWLRKKTHGKSNLVSRVRNRLFKTGTVVFSEPAQGYHKELFDVRASNVVMRGYFQSEKYFLSVEQDIRKLYSFKGNDIGEWSEYFNNDLSVGKRVSVHVRRTDYITNEVSNFAGRDYYERALRSIQEMIPDAVIYFFSDDMAWVQKEIGSWVNSPVYIEGNKNERAYMDMHLMSLCDHHIIANSSFSWWGSWLNNKPGKITIAPKKWFFNEREKNDDLVPAHWIKI